MFYKALTFLVVASPCALIISTPAAVLSAIGRAATRGVLFKSGESLVALGHVRAIAFDKTGTLTQGHAALTDIAPLNGAGERELLAMAASVEAGSTHPLAQAITGAAIERGVDFTRASDATTHAGRGASGVTAAGVRVLVGNRDFLKGEGLSIDALADSLLTRFESAGKTAVLVGSTRVLGVLALADPVRREAASAIQVLRQGGIESIVMLTGDHARVASAIAGPLGIDSIHAQLMPEGKADAVEELLRRHRAVAIVGDGINDAPALASASVGIAMGGSGNDVVLESADVVLMADDLSRLAFAVGLSRRANRIIKQNLTFALMVIAILLIGTMTGNIRLPIGVIGHEGSTLIVVINSLRLLWHK
jgi:Cd2+/Zn2+-exporting ATPase